MLTTVFKDKIPKGTSYPLPLEFLRRVLTGAAQRQVALYFVHGSLWVLGKHNVSRERLLYEPRSLLSAGRSRPMFRNNNDKIPADVEDFDWHFLLWAVPSERRHDLQKQFEDTAAQPLAHWLVDRKPRSTRAQVWWYPDRETILVTFQ